MAGEKTPQSWSTFLSTLTAVTLGMAIYGLVDRFVLSKIANHLENLLEGEEE